jgi:hypothetical protein
MGAAEDDDAPIATAQARCGRRDNTIPVQNSPRHRHRVETWWFFWRIGGVARFCGQTGRFCDTINGPRANTRGTLSRGHPGRIPTPWNDGNVDRKAKASAEMEKSTTLPQQRTPTKRRMARWESDDSVLVKDDS